MAKKLKSIVSLKKLNICSSLGVCLHNTAVQISSVENMLTVVIGMSLPLHLCLNCSSCEEDSCLL